MSTKTPFVPNADGTALVLLQVGDNLPADCMPDLMSKNKSDFMAYGFTASSAGNISFIPANTSYSSDITVTSNITINLPANKKFDVDAVLNTTVTLGTPNFGIVVNSGIIRNTVKSITIGNTTFIRGVLVTGTSGATVNLNVSGTGVTLSIGSNSYFCIEEQ